MYDEHSAAYMYMYMYVLLKLVQVPVSTIEAIEIYSARCLSGLLCSSLIYVLFLSRYPPLYPQFHSVGFSTFNVVLVMHMDGVWSIHV